MGERFLKHSAAGKNFFKVKVCKKRGGSKDFFHREGSLFSGFFVGEVGS